MAVMVCASIATTIPYDCPINQFKTFSHAHTPNYSIPFGCSPPSITCLPSHCIAKLINSFGSLEMMALRRMMMYGPSQQSRFSGEWWKITFFSFGGLSGRSGDSSQSKWTVINQIIDFLSNILGWCGRFEMTTCLMRGRRQWVEWNAFPKEAKNRRDDLQPERITLCETDNNVNNGIPLTTIHELSFANMQFVSFFFVFFLKENWKNKQTFVLCKFWFHPFLACPLVRLWQKEKNSLVIPLMTSFGTVIYAKRVKRYVDTWAGRHAIGHDKRHPGSLAEAIALPWLNRYRSRHIDGYRQLSIHYICFGLTSLRSWIIEWFSIVSFCWICQQHFAGVVALGRMALVG